MGPEDEIGEPEPFDWLLEKHVQYMLIVTSYPGQPEKTSPAPGHLREHILKYGMNLPYIREATMQELIEYLSEIEPISPP